MTGSRGFGEDPPPRRITFLTDFGTADGYVAAMRGVIASLAPRVHVDDISHAIRPGDIEAAAWALGRYWRSYPEGSVHVVVVDPGVGGSRRAVAVRALGRFLIAPDNGVLGYVLKDAPSVDAVSIENPARMRHPVSATFHGRDVFAPAAAYVAIHGELTGLGGPANNLECLDVPDPVREGATVRGVVLHVDGFGNLITNVPGDWVNPRDRVSIEDVEIGSLRQTYVDVVAGERLALIGSSDLLEVSVRDGDAAVALSVSRGARVTVRSAE